jgi:hypothetical protein
MVEGGPGILSFIRLIRGNAMNWQAWGVTWETANTFWLMVC